MAERLPSKQNVAGSSPVSRSTECTGPAHVDRPRYSLFANLGMVPEGVALTGAEISGHITEEEALARFPSLKGIPLVRSGDAHRLEEMIHATRLRVSDLTLLELRRALLKEGGRRVFLRGP